MAGITCPSCGGKMIFDIPKQKLLCPYCNSVKEIEEYNLDNEAEEHEEMSDAIVYICKNCGAELTAFDEEAVAYCSYCGSEAMLNGKHEQVLKPKRIIPFKKSKQQAKNAYEKALQKKLYVPKEFKEADFLESFRGIYLPYYAYEGVVSSKTLNVEGTKQYTRGSYDYKEEYNVKADIGGLSKVVRYDASISFDDTIANEIAPFQIKDEVTYRDEYVAGFYSDRATTPVDTYIKEATEETLDSVYAEIGKRAGNINIKKPVSVDKQKEDIEIDSFNCNVTLFPVWFLTWKNKNRVAYSVMNGQTGKLSADIPVDKKKFFLISLIAAVIIFLILSLLPIFILPKTVSVIAAVILVISGYFLKNEIVAIYEKEKHIYDLGDQIHKEKKKRIRRKTAVGQTQTSNAKTKVTGCAVVFFAYIGVYIIVFFVTLIRGFANLTSSTGFNSVVFVIAFILQVIISFLIIRRSITLDKKSAVVSALLAPLALAFATVVSIANPAHDYWYYGAALVSLLVLVINGLSLINHFNYLTTRPVPNFFLRKGADHEA